MKTAGEAIAVKQSSHRPGLAPTLGLRAESLQAFAVFSWFGALAFYQKALVASTGLASAWLAFITGRGVLRKYQKRRRSACPSPKNLPDIDAFTRGGTGERRRAPRRGGPAIE